MLWADLFDWSHEVVLLSGVTVTVKSGRVRLCHSRILFVRAYRRETQEMVFDAHDRAFALFIELMSDPISATSRQFKNYVFYSRGGLLCSGQY